MVDDEHLYKYKTRGENISRDSRDSEKKKSRASRKSRQVLEQQQLLWTAARESYVAEKWEEEWAKRIPADAREDGWRFYYFWSPSFFLYILLIRFDRPAQQSRLVMSRNILYSWSAGGTKKNIQIKNCLRLMLLLTIDYRCGDEKETS
jgi:hypothetical protein